MSDKLGHQAPKGMRLNDHFHYVEIDGELHYCYSHDFVYNDVEEERKLYNAQPCHYTDNRYVDGKHNYFKNCYLYWVRARWGRKHELSLKACMRVVNQCRNIPIDTVVHFNRDWYYTSKKGNYINMGYKFKVRKENLFDPKYQINMTSYGRDFRECERSQKLTEALRANGFIVSVSKGNPDFLMEMIGTAQEYTSGQRDADMEAGGQIATAYGHGIKIGFSSEDNTYRGYSYGCKSILYDYFQEFNKWSQCYEIDKELPADEIVKILLKPRKDD